ncbi:EF-hand domain-containing protein [Paucibacter sp. Y2R2-4]|uniref:EF-hand domain-containing protein n=1 Tax=Paucibacter sp. Y2R2-4 TaxID=2893553 RepID=UPI0021E43C05|nr:EF-hand domain-containing protein [Paucibacter sp. Y2R2-4]MCV2349188.1 EF-hand domain-containing protein [Paucibacter sp. Y2R2-4]
MNTSFKPMRALLAAAVALALGTGASCALAEGSAKVAHPQGATSKDKANEKAIAKVLGASSPSAAKQAFAAADLDNDGVVSLDEFHKDIVKSWHALDLDHNGEITRSELESIPDRGAVRAMLRMLQRSDSNGDMKLSFKELVEARMAFFDEADADHDDRLTLSEALAFEAKHHPKASAAASAKASKAEPAAAAGK